MRDEFGFHLEMRVRDLVAEGLSPQEARAEARRRFGNLQNTTQLLKAQLFNTSPNDPLTLVLVTVLFTVVALVATTVPALRAASVDPTTALRAD